MTEFESERLRSETSEEDPAETLADEPVDPADVDPEGTEGEVEAPEETPEDMPAEPEMPEETPEDSPPVDAPDTSPPEETPEDGEE